MSLATFLGDALDERRAELTRAWLDELLARLHVRPRRALPERDLLDHVPSLLERLAEFLRTPDSTALQDEVAIRELRALATLRYEQGYDSQELLEEFEALGDILYGTLIERATAYGGEADPAEMARVTRRLHTGLIAMCMVTIGCYREKDAKRRRDRARDLAELGLAISHELRNPLQTVITAVDLLETEAVAADPERRRTEAEKIRRSLERINARLKEVRLLAADVEDLEKRPESLRSVVDQVFEELNPFAEEQGVRLRGHESVPDREVDGAPVELVLVNLVGNAIKYSDPDKGERWVEVSAEQEDGNAVRLSVADNGLGIAPGEQTRIFERFYRSPATNVGGVEGTGLGLAIARQAAERLGGPIAVESEPGSGSVFSFQVGGTGPGG